MPREPYYITNAIPYVNGAPHIGHALEYVESDAIARYERLEGNEVFYLVGTDENSLKNVQAAEGAGKPVKEFVDEQAQRFIDLRNSLDLSFDGFVRTTESRHFLGAQKLWSACNPDDIEKRTYKGLYCVGCEMFYAEDELAEGLCPEHKKAPEIVEEENYFFKLSKPEYGQKLTDLITSGTLKIIPEFRKNEVLAFIARGLEDFSISRTQERARGWGVPVPGDSTQIMYVWFDALANYITGIDYATDGELYKKYWEQPDSGHREVVHIIGKGIIRFHAIYWIAMLLSAHLPLPTKIFAHGYLTVEGQKMSKSLGNVIDPSALVAKYGIDPVRFYLLGAVSSYQDGDFSVARFEEFYTAHLANGIGNLTSRILTMLEKYNESKVPKCAPDRYSTEIFWKHYHEAFSEYRFEDVTKTITNFVAALDGSISTEQPWKKVKEGENMLPFLYQTAEALRHLAIALLPIMPTAAAKILTQLGIENTAPIWGELPEGGILSKGEPLFPRLTII